MQIADKFDISKWGALDPFLARHYREDLALRDRRLFEWQFISKDGEANLINAFVDDELVGILGYLPVELFWGETSSSVNGAFFMNWFVVDAHRSGLGWMMLRRLQKGYSVLLSSSPSSDNLSITETLGWKYFESIDRYIVVLDADGTSELLAKKETMLDSYTPKKVSAAMPYKLDTNSFSPDWNSYQNMRYGIKRDASYLKWRYEEHPVFRYLMFAKGSVSKPSVIVLRIEESSGAAQRKVAKICEFFHPDGAADEALELMFEVFGFLAQNGVVFADIVMTNKIFGETLLRAGFGLETKNEVMFPHRLTPIDGKDRGFCVQIGTKGEAYPDIGALYYTRCDCDDDRVVSLKDIHG